jgi:hypothetical protein
MGERRTNDSTRDLLEEVDSGWFSAPPPRTDTPLPAPVFEPSLSELSPSVPDVAELDAGWAEDPTPHELQSAREERAKPDRARPSKRLDTEAFARSKREQEERAAQKRERKRSKAADKRARHAARAEATQSKQKAKRARPERSVTSLRKTERNLDARPAAKRKLASVEPVEPIEPIEPTHAPSISAPARTLSRAKANTSASLKVLAIVLAVLIAGSIALAALVRH